MIVLCVVFFVPKGQPPAATGGPPAAAAPQAPVTAAASGGSEAASREISPALAQAILGTPSLTLTFFDDAKKQLVVQEATNRADGTRLLRLSADAERRTAPESAAVPVGVVMDVVVDGTGKVHSSRLVRIDDAEMKELEALLSR